MNVQYLFVYLTVIEEEKQLNWKWKWHEFIINVYCAVVKFIIVRVEICRFVHRTNVSLSIKLSFCLECWAPIIIRSDKDPTNPSNHLHIHIHIHIRISEYNWTNKKNKIRLNWFVWNRYLPQNISMPPKFL